MRKADMHNTLQNFSITSCIAIFAFSFGTGRLELFVLPLVITAAAAWRIAYYRMGMVRLASYIAIFIEPELEGVGWETRRIATSPVSELGFGKKRWRKGVLRLIDILSIALLCIVFLFTLEGELLGLKGALLVIGLVLLLITCWGVGRAASMDKVRYECEKEWRSVRNIGVSHGIINELKRF